VRKLLLVLLLLVAGVVGLGFYRDWFTFSTSSDPETGKAGVHLGVDPDKMKSDAETARKKISDAVQQPTEQPAGK
jgi:hypothetical protein